MQGSETKMIKIGPVAAILLPIIFSSLLLSGCNAGFDDPVSPSIAGIPQGRNIWGLWNIELDPGSGRIDITPIRQADFHLNVVNSLQLPNPAGIQIAINSFQPDEGSVDLDLTIIHPYPDSNLRGFDVRGIVMGSGNSITAKSDPDLFYSAPDGLRLLNADGYTRWWNNSEFTTSGLYGFTPGILGTPGFTPVTTLNPYKYFADILLPDDPVVPNVDISNRGTFSTYPDPPQLTRNYQIQFPMVGGNPEWKFQYAIDACWDLPTGGSPKPKPVEDFPISANCPEAFHIEVDTSWSSTYLVNPTYFGGDVVLEVEVFDWGIPSNPEGPSGEIVSIIFESETLFDSVTTVSGDILTTGDSETGGIFQISIPDVHPTGSDNQEVLITVLSKNLTSYEPPIFGPDYPDTPPLAAYALVEIPIREAYIEVIAPNGGEEWQVGSDQVIDWSSEGLVLKIEIWLSLDGGETWPYVLITQLGNLGEWMWENIPEEYVTDQARIKVRASEYSFVRDINDETFTIL